MNTPAIEHPPRYPTLDEVASRPRTAIDHDPIAVLDHRPDPIDVIDVPGTQGPMLFEGSPSPLTPAFPLTPPTPSYCSLCDKFAVAMSVPRQLPPGFESAMVPFPSGPGIWRAWGDSYGVAHMVLSVPVADLQDRYLAYQAEVAGWMPETRPESPTR